MNHYVDIFLLPDPEFTSSVLMNTLFEKLHRALVKLQSDDIGVSFPDYKIDDMNMGDALRLHGGAASLNRVIELDWLRGMRDHVEVAGPNMVERGASFGAVRRVQVKSNPERLRRRLVKRKGVDIDEARRLIPDTVEKSLDLPFIQITSRSTRQTFKIFVEQKQSDEHCAGRFNAYGFSRTATVPLF